MNPVKRTGLGAAGGAALAVAFLLIGVLRAVIVLLRGRSVGFTGFLTTALWYVYGFAMGGAFVGLLWPLTRWRPLRYVVGILAAACFVGALLIDDDGPPWAWSRDTTTLWLGLSGAFGLAAGLGIDRGMAAA